MWPEFLLIEYLYMLTIFLYHCIDDSFILEIIESTGRVDHLPSHLE
jgi:hypothetical protein